MLISLSHAVGALLVMAHPNRWASLDAGSELPNVPSNSIMKTTSLILAPIVTTILATATFALTTEHVVTAAYVRQHPQEFAVKVAKGKDGLIDFTITHNVPRPMYHVAHLAIYHQGKLIATSDTPSFGKKQDNTFHFSIAAEDVAESKFDLSDSALAGSGDDAVPIPGTIVHQFRLLDFVPKKLLRSAVSK